MGHHALAIGSLKPLPTEVMTSPLLDSVTVVTEPGCAGYYGPGTEVVLVPGVDDFTAVRDAALGVLGDRPIDAILTPTEFGVATGGLLRSYFGLPGEGFETAHAFANKYVMKRRLAAAGVPVAPFRQAFRLDGLPAAAEDLGWPVVVKPVFGSGTVGVDVIESPVRFREFRESPAGAALRTAGCPLIVERYVDIETEYHCDGVVTDGEPVFVSVSRYLRPVLDGVGHMQGSHHLPPDHPDAVAVRELHTAAVRALGMRAGVTHLEVLRTSEGFLVGEIACRPGGGGIVRGVRLQHGVDLWQAYTETSLGLRPALAPVERADLVVNVMLPARPGRITRLSSAEELAAVPGVTEVDLAHKPGDVISDVMYSTNLAGLVYLAAPALDDVDPLVEGVSDAYVFDVSSASPVSV